MNWALFLPLLALIVIAIIGMVWAQLQTKKSMKTAVESQNKLVEAINHLADVIAKKQS
ncbi:MAG: hypothetical protein JW856_01100 [Dehalococcoidales bacterium]|nr:hypothetical protein [Dehalococcoidales bacterium]